jgi:two-component system CheB/CheR fusion protein
VSNTSIDPAFEKLLSFLRANRGFDFTGYKRASLMRRVTKRMQQVSIGEFEDYIDYLQVYPDEFTHLFDTILINVTSFFRDTPSWSYLSEHVLPAIVERKRAGEPIRIWSAGCASGEEPYSIAMLAAEALKRETLTDQMKIYATDVDEHALAQARAGAYTEKEIESIPPRLRAKYLEATDSGFSVRKELRRAVIFGRHDLVQDAPISRVDLILCRNVLMYFNADIQTKIYRQFHFAMNSGGYLFLGKSEMLLTRTEMFLPVDLKKRFFRKVAARDESPTFHGVLGSTTDGGGTIAPPLPDAVFEQSPTAQVVIDESGTLVAVNENARTLFGVSRSELGRPFHEVELSYRPVELRSKIAEALAVGRAVGDTVSWVSPAGETVKLEVEIVPLVAGEHPLGAVIVFGDVTGTSELRDELVRTRSELETAHEELQSTVEELETTNEELQSTNEELETTNEELQSTNEELETMNEELHSTNEELEAINNELRDRTDQLNQSNDFLEGIVGSLQAGVVVLDPELTVKSWNATAEDLWGLRSTEVVGRNFLGLDIGLPVSELAPAVREGFSADGAPQELVVAATNRRGRPVLCRVNISVMRNRDEHVHGVILVMAAVERNFVPEVEPE